MAGEPTPPPPVVHVPPSPKYDDDDDDDDDNDGAYDAGLDARAETPPRPRELWQKVIAAIVFAAALADWSRNGDRRLATRENIMIKKIKG